MSQINPLSLIMAGLFIAFIAILAFVLAKQEKPVEVTIAAVIEADEWQGDDGARYKLWGYHRPDPGTTHDTWPEGYRDECTVAYKALRDGKDYMAELIQGKKITITASYGQKNGFNMVSAQTDNQDLGERLKRLDYVKEWKQDENNNPLEPKPIWCRTSGDGAKMR